jgi:hypothetical protein
MSSKSLGYLGIYGKDSSSLVAFMQFGVLDK